MFKFIPETIPPKFQPTKDWPKGRLTELLGDARKNGENGLKTDAPKADAKDAKPQNKTDTQAKAEQPAQTAAKQNQQTNAQMDAPDDGDAPQAKEPAKLEKTGYRPPEAFAPTVAAGALTAVVNQKANAVPHDDVSEYRQGDEFKLGKGGYGMKKRLEDDRRDQYDDGYNGNSAKSERMTMQAYAQMQLQQQRESFARTTEYSVALNTTRDAIKEQQVKIDRARDEYRVLQEQKAQNEVETAEAARVVETTGAAADAQDAHVAGVAQTMDVQAQHEQNVAAANAADADLTQSEGRRQEVVDSTIKATFYGDDTYYELKENGVDVAYKVGPDGVAHKIDPKDISDEVRCQMAVPLSVETQAGKRTIVGAYDKELPPEQAEKVKAFLKSQNKDETDLAGSNDMANANMDVTYRRNTAINAFDAAAITEEQLKEAQQKYNIPDSAMKDLQSMSSYYNEQVKVAEKLRADHKDAITEYEKLKAEGKEIDKDLKSKVEELYNLEADNKRFKEFEKKLANKEFKDEEDMINNMPEELRDEYRAKLKQTAKVEAKTEAKADASTQPTKEASAEKSQTATAENTSRTNGSAAPSGIPGEPLGQEFNAAASGDTTASEPAPANDPAPDQEQVIAANASQTRPAGAGMGM